MFVQERGQNVEPALVGHDHVQQDHVRLRRPRLEHGFARCAGLADGLEAVLCLEQEAQARPDDCMVVDDQHADAHETGTSATIVVPPPVRDSI